MALASLCAGADAATEDDASASTRDLTEIVAVTVPYWGVVDSRGVAQRGFICLESVDESMQLVDAPKFSPVSAVLIEAGCVCVELIPVAPVT